MPVGPMGPSHGGMPHLGPHLMHPHHNHPNLQI